jgi:glycosyltransferase involved in cell wall biosynthesis
LDPFDEKSNFEDVLRILNNPEVLRKMKRSGLQTASNYSVHSAAVSEILVMEEALHNRRVSHPRLEKNQLYLLPGFVSEGAISVAGYERINIPYQCPILRAKWQVIQIANLPLPESASMIVIQGDVPSVSVKQLLNWLTAWKATGGKLVYEIDEKFYEHANFRSEIDSFNSEFVANKAVILAINADVIHVPTAHLAQCLAKYNKNIRVIPCALDSVLWRLDEHRRHDKGSFRKLPNGPIRIGFIGTDNDYENLKSVADAMKLISEKYGSRVEIEVIGGYQKRKEIFGKRVGFPKKNLYLDYINWLQDRVHWDIGIIPLASSSDYLFDSYLQFLKYSALDLAIVASDRGQYIDIAKDMHNALVVSDSSDAWVDAISKLVDDASLRRRLALAARNDLCRSHTFESIGNLIVDSLSKVIN